MPSASVLESYSGEPHVEVLHWIRKVDLLSKVHSWSELQTFCADCVSLDGPAAVWLDTVSVTTWTELKQLLSVLV